MSWLRCFLVIRSRWHWKDMPLIRMPDTLCFTETLGVTNPTPCGTDRSVGKALAQTSLQSARYSGPAAVHKPPYPESRQQSTGQVVALGTRIPSHRWPEPAGAGCSRRPYLRLGSMCTADAAIAPVPQKNRGQPFHAALAASSLPR